MSSPDEAPPTYDDVVAGAGQHSYYSYEYSEDAACPAVPFAVRHVAADDDR